MIRSLWIAKTGLDAQQTNMDVISNNLANVSTNGFKRQRAVFEDLLYQTVRQPGAQSSEQTTLPSGLQLGTGVRTVSTERLHSQGNLEQTDNSKDVAINGKGFFQVQMPDGSTAYTRDGSFQVDQNGQMVTSSGYPIQPAITIPDNALTVTIARDGVVSVTVQRQANSTQVGQLTLSNFINEAGLQSLGENLYQETDCSGAPNESTPGQNGAGASASGSRVQINQLSGGRINNGAVIERELPSTFDHSPLLSLQLKTENFSLSQRISDAINRFNGMGVARALDARTVEVSLTADNSAQVRFLAQIQDIDIAVGQMDAKVIINSRTGSVVMNRNVTLDNCAVAQGNLSVVVDSQLNVSQPDTPFTNGNTVVTPQTQISVRQNGGSLQKVESSASLNNVIRAMNALGATPNDLMSILQAMKSAGCLQAELEII